MTWNKDRKQTKYGHKRREHMTHTTEDWQIYWFAAQETFLIITLKCTEPFKGHCGGKKSEWVEKIQGEWKKFRVGGKNIFQMFCVLSQNFCVLSQNFCVPSRNFAFSRKTFAFSRKDICVPSQNFCVPSRNFAFPRKTFAFSRKYFFFFKFCEGTQISLRENAKVLRENAKFLEGTQKFCERTQNIWKIFFPPTLNFFPLTPNFSHHNVP